MHRNTTFREHSGYFESWLPDTESLLIQLCDHLFHSGFVFASVDYRQSITTVNTDEYFPTSINDNYRNRGLALSMGVRFIIGKPEPEGPKDIIDNPVD